MSSTLNQEKSAPLARRNSWVLWTVVLGCAAVAGWATVYEIDEVVRASGTVIASSRVQVIQSVDGGVMASLRVKEGDRVEKGQVLATLEQVRVGAAVNELQAKLAALRAQVARLQAEVTGAGGINFTKDVLAYPDIVRVQRALFTQKMSGLKEELRTLRVAVDLAREDAKLVHELAKTGDVSRSEVIRAERALNDADAQLINRRNKYLQEARTELAKAEDDIAQADQVRTQRAQQLEDSVFKAAMAGVVKNVRVTTQGGVLKSGEELMQIVPVDDAMIIEAKVNPADIARIKPGLETNLRFDPFDYTIFGAVAGKVSYVSADTLKEENSQKGEQTYYRVHVVTKTAPVVSQTGRKLDILPGMTAQVDIKTGSRSVLHYLLKPLYKTTSEAFGER
jgi:adhesin transport system membrane fusion protein